MRNCVLREVYKNKNRTTRMKIVQRIKMCNMILQFKRLQAVFVENMYYTGRYYKTYQTEKQKRKKKIDKFNIVVQKSLTFSLRSQKGKDNHLNCQINHFYKLGGKRQIYKKNREKMK